MALNRQLREDLLVKLGVGQRRLNQLAAARARELPMSHEQAVHTIAHENGLMLSTYLTEAEISEARRLLTELRAVQVPNAATTANGGTTARSSKPKPTLISIAGMKVERLPGMTATHAQEAKQMAEKVYPALYVFENSARDLITRVLKAALGDDWWDKVVPQKVREKTSSRKRDEAKDPWHGKRGAALIDYLDLTDLPSIVAAPKAWPYFKPFFERSSWVPRARQRAQRLPSRCGAHEPACTRRREKRGSGVSKVEQGAEGQGGADSVSESRRPTQRARRA